MKKILINALLLNNEFAGVQYAIENLLYGLSRTHNTDLYVEVLLSNGYEGNLTEHEFFKLKRIKFNTKNRFARIYFENIMLPTYFKKNDFDLYHSPGYVLPYFANMPSIVTVHDLIALDFPDLCQNETALYYRLCLPNAIEKSVKILTVSNTIKMDILKRFTTIKEDKVEVIYHGIHERFKKTSDLARLESVKVKYKLPSLFFLFVGNLEPKKNINRIIEAFAITKRNSNSKHKLVIAGKKGWKYGPIFKLIQKLELQTDVLFLGYVDENDLPTIYSLAAIFLFPSLYEGFGLPVLEAMACGCPVILSCKGALPEISGNICLQVNPNNPSEIASKIRNLLEDDTLRKSQVQKGIIWSKKFKWKHTAKKTVDLYRSILLQ